MEFSSFGKVGLLAALHIVRLAAGRGPINLCSSCQSEAIPVGPLGAWSAVCLVVSVCVGGCLSVSEDSIGNFVGPPGADLLREVCPAAS